MNQRITQAQQVIETTLKTGKLLPCRRVLRKYLRVALYAEFYANPQHTISYWGGVPNTHMSHIVAQLGLFELMPTLQKLGWTFFEKDANGNTPLHIMFLHRYSNDLASALRGQPDACEKTQANIDSFFTFFQTLLSGTPHAFIEPNDFGNRPMDILSQYDYSYGTLVQNLHRCGVDVFFKSPKSASDFSIAELYFHYHFYDYLRNTNLLTHTPELIDKNPQTDRTLIWFAQNFSKKIFTLAAPPNTVSRSVWQRFIACHPVIRTALEKKIIEHALETNQPNSPGTINTNRSARSI